MAAAATAASTCAGYKPATNAIVSKLMVAFCNHTAVGNPETVEPLQGKLLRAARSAHQTAKQVSEEALGRGGRTPNNATSHKPP
jgi:hypothetical protein